MVCLLCVDRAMVYVDEGNKCRNKLFFITFWVDGGLIEYVYVFIAQYKLIGSGCVVAIIVWLILIVNESVAVCQMMVIALRIYTYIIPICF